jgi:transposase
MPKPCSLELRERVVEAVESGASRREAAEWFDVSPSSAIKWMQRRRETGSIAAKPSGGSISPLERHADFLLALVAGQPDLTLDEIVAAMRKRRISGSRSAVWRLRAAQYQLQKKACGRQSKSGRTWLAHGGAGYKNRTCLTRPDWYSLTRPRPTPPWCGFEAAARAAFD